MGYRDLKAFVQALEKDKRLKHVAAEVDKDWEIACISRWVSEGISQDDIFALQFDKVKGYPTPVVVGLYASYDLYARALNIQPQEILSHWSQALEQPLQPKIVDVAPVQEVVDTGAAANLFDIPIPVWTPGRDGGPYIPSASVITRDPDTGIQNMGVYRLQLHDRQTMGLFFGTDRQHGAMHYAKYCQRNEPMPIALVVGGPPAVNFAAAAKTAYGVDELEIAGGLAGGGIAVIPGTTVDLLVPAQAEYIIEGVVSPQKRILEGPFGEALGYMNLAAPAPVVDISAICRRKDPVFHGYLQQLPPSEGHIIWEMGALGSLWYYVREKLALEALQDLAITRGSAGLATLVVQLKLGQAEAARQISTILSKINFGQKFIILVDEDIDIRDPDSLQWAISSRVDPARDTKVLENIPSYQLDPSILAEISKKDAEDQVPPYSSSLMVIDATLKSDTPEIALPGAACMNKALQRWPELGLPPLAARNRIKRLLKYHSDSDLCFQLPQEVGLG